MTEPDTSKKRVVFREGDMFIINVPKFVVRVGYPLCIDDIKREFDIGPTDVRIRNFLSEFGLCEGGVRGIDPYDVNVNDGIVNEFKTILARHTLHLRRWGGNKRSVYEIEIPELAGTTHCVYKKRVVKTGIRVGPSGTGEDFEPVYLEDMKTHIILEFPHCKFRHNRGEILQEHVHRLN